MSTLDKLIEKARPLIAAWGLSAESVEDSGFRDNGVAIYSDEAVRFRIESEQGNPLLDVASRIDPDNWFDVSLLLNLARGQSLLQQNTFDAMVAFAIADQAPLRARLTTGLDQFRLEIAAAEKARFKEMFPGVPIG